MDAERKIATIWAEAAPAAHDPDFVVAVMARVERRRMWRELADLAPLVIAVGVLAWALAPAAEHLFEAGVAGTGELATAGFLMAASVLLGIWLAVGGPGTHRLISALS